MYVIATALVGVGRSRSIILAGAVVVTKAHYPYASYTSIPSLAMRR
jgi:hypothetical protein